MLQPASNLGESKITIQYNRQAQQHTRQKNVQGLTNSSANSSILIYVQRVYELCNIGKPSFIQYYALK